MTPLHYACRYGRLNIPREKRKSSLQTSAFNTPIISTPIHSIGENEEARSLISVVKAIEDRLDAVMDCLLINGADINAQDKYGMTPIHHTAIRGNQKALQKRFTLNV